MLHFFIETLCSFFIYFYLGVYKDATSVAVFTGGTYCDVLTEKVRKVTNVLTVNDDGTSLTYNHYTTDAVQKIMPPSKPVGTKATEKKQLCNKCRVRIKDLTSDEVKQHLVTASL